MAFAVSASGPPLLRAVVFIPLAVGLLVAAAFAAGGAQAFVRQSEAADGVVTRLLAGPSHPEIRFVTAAGQTAVYPQGGLVGGYKVGEAVRVRYRPADPRGSACVDRWPAIWGGTLLLLALGAGAAFAGVASALEAARR